jgi:leucyl-tRNA synthetase
LHNKIKDRLSSKSNDIEIDKFTNQMIVKITNNLESFHYNVIVANMYETYNFLTKKIEEDIDSEKLLKNYQKILTIFSPIIPHFTAECLEDLKFNDKLSWPKAEKVYLSEDNLDYVIQINGKKRAILNEKRDLDQENLLNEIKSNNITKKYLENKSIKKIIFVKNRLINLLLND